MDDQPTNPNDTTAVLQIIAFVVALLIFGPVVFFVIWPFLAFVIPLVIIGMIIFAVLACVSWVFEMFTTRK